jgi:hypothetical protein
MTRGFYFKALVPTHKSAEGAEEFQVQSAEGAAI